VSEDVLLAELRALRDRVVGITDTALASRDGLIIRADTVDISPDNIAALAAASQGLAQRMAAEAGKGALREAMTRGSGGCVAVYPVGAVALLAVVGDEGLDTVRLYRESRATVEHLERLLTGGADRGKPQAAAS
jgi:predicted regulator of Ras-like GTPase activity (Roadblock/LC7/MglB family)